MNLPLRCCAFVLSLALAVGLKAAQQPAWPPDPPTMIPPAVEETYTLKVVAGQNGVNVLKRHSAVAPVVQVLDHNEHPVAGAVVNFTTPDMGPTVKFINGERTFSAVTEVDGRARASGVQPAAGAGPLKIAVTATYDNRVVASAFINQTNYATVEDAEHSGVKVPPRSTGNGNDPSERGGLSAGAVTAIVLTIAAAAAAGIFLGLHHDGSGTSH